MSSENVIDVANGIEGSKKLPVFPFPASHEDVVGDVTLFFSTLRNFHSLSGTKIIVPVIDGRELNLHVLYVEVTRRGGFHKVVAERSWREVGRLLGFGQTTTSSSFTLKKHYNALLLGYESMYFLRNDDPTLEQTEKIPPFEAMGIIDAKFDCGYLVSMKIGDQVLSGVIYHPGYSAPTPAPSPVFVVAPPSLQYENAIVPFVPPPQERRRRYRKRRAGDLARPKTNRSGYNFFFAERYKELKAKIPEKEREFTKMIGYAWTKMSAHEKAVYQQYGMQDKERYQRELQEYKQRVTGEVAAEQQLNSN